MPFLFAGHRVPQGIGSGGFYAGTKHAVRAMTEGLRQEARTAGVPLKVSEISPGVVHTNFFATMSDGDEALMARWISHYIPCPSIEHFFKTNPKKIRVRGSEVKFCVVATYMYFISASDSDHLLKQEITTTKLMTGLPKQCKCTQQQHTCTLCHVRAKVNQNTPTLPQNHQ